MKVEILHLVEGAKKAKGLTVIIDVFRAFSMEAYMFAAGAEKVIPVGDLQIAWDYKKAHPDAILCGERGGVKVEGFDHGNSPTQIEGLDFTGKTLIHTTSAGTQGVANALGADEIIGGSLVTAKAIADYVKYTNPAHVSLVCMGLHGKKQSDEDTLCGEYIKSRIDGKPLEDLEERIEKLKLTNGAQFFKPELRDVFPERDFTLCTRANAFPFVLRLKQDENGGLAYMERINIADLNKNAIPEGMEVTVPEIHEGDMASILSREQAICLPNEIKKVLVYGNYEAPENNFDAALVLGGGTYAMQSRAKAAAALYHSGQCKLFITTGGVYHDTPFGCLSETAAIKQYMIKEGVPAECILEEDLATITRENMFNSKSMLIQHFGTRKLKLAIVTSYFHLVRSVKLAEACFENADIFGVKADLPFDNPEEFHTDPATLDRVTTESRLLCHYAKTGIIKDFPILHK